MHARNELYIDGAWVTPAEHARVIEVVNPATEQVIGHVPHGTAADVDRAVTAARRAWDPDVDLVERRRRVDSIIEATKRHLPAIAALITAEMGAPIRIAESVQTKVPLAVAKGILEVLDQPEKTERISNSVILREPYGVVGAITPWNYPLYQVIAKLVPAVAAGCTIVLKPSNEAPLSVFAFFDALHEADLPPGVVNLVSGPGRVVGEAIAGHPDVDFVSFTGSTGAGARVAEVAGAAVSKVALELGGKSANVILADADLTAAVKVGVSNAFLNGGQTCMAWTRMLVPADRYGEALDIAAAAAAKFTVGDPTDPSTRLGPSATASQFETVRGFIDRALAAGARPVTGGSERVLSPGYYLAPTILADVDPMSEIAQEEVFGPVLVVIPHTGDDDAVRIANCTPYGLSGAVWAGSDERAVSVAKRIRTGQLDINGGAYNPRAPFGGYKKSGFGRELGPYGYEEFLQIKSLQMPT
ncbi:aldehyde dehydrogenase [Rhodococcus aetherivorans]|uniref:aldehyde dehydrogenase (NAD(+)) n=1 Tax=Rhodococcus aetherivorans TaxID=191292 RepID=A0ABQ0YHP8_9NOCA|nr:aldehyde dehydrogenase family protein [Rhodococcus aetherivorans]ETT25292.1 Aldehyde Dehydrogenase [Rhodococcus rhodochrous ATCC 21198]NGP29667.1 aldehyde dehydrogenase family protein [Rhodococcus aetherivorans]GES36002.1 aldehyde dehydrogenase [Rhodococcus aetherivorans]